MQWSKLKTRLMAQVVPELRGRVDFHQTVYRVHHKDDGQVCTCNKAREFWITVDKVKVFRASYCKYAFESFVIWWVDGVSPLSDSPEGEHARKELQLMELHSPHDAVESLRRYLDFDPQTALTSDDPILKAFAIIDRRIGARTLKQLQIEDNEHSLVRLFYLLRSSTGRATDS